MKIFTLNIVAFFLLFLVGCDRSVSFIELNNRSGTYYLGDSKEPYSGTVEDIPIFNPGKRKTIINFENGIMIGATVIKPDGEKCVETAIDDGNGSIIFYRSDGSKYSKDTYENGTKIEVTEYDLFDGSISCIRSFKDGDIEGWVDYENGIKTGETQFFEDNGEDKVEKTTYFRDGLMWSKTQYNRYEPGGALEIFYTKEGKVNNTVVDKYQNGQIRKETIFKDGLRVFEVSFNQDGSKAWELPYVDGMPDYESEKVYGSAFSPGKAHKMWEEALEDLKSDKAP